jgi:hypothetical protein
MIRRFLHLFGFHPWTQMGAPGKIWTLYQCPICKCGLIVENDEKPLGWGNILRPRTRF